MKQIITSSIFLISFVSVYGQSFSDESINFNMFQSPKVVIEEANKTFDVHVSSPYNLTANEIYEQSKIDHQNDLDNYDDVVKQSETDYQDVLKNFAEEEKRAKEKFKTEDEAFNKMSLLERLTLIDQGKKPKLVLPTKPMYYKPNAPVYREPNLNNYIIIDNNVLASQINIPQFKKGNGNGYVNINLSVSQVNFQDNAGQTYAKQPTRLQIKENGAVKIDETFFNEFKFIASSPTNSINAVQEEKRHLESVVKFINTYLSERYSNQEQVRTIKLTTIKNKKNKYDDIEKGHIYITTNLKKLSTDEKRNAEAFKGIENGVELWTKALQKIDFKNSKADYNAKVAKNLYMNFIRLYLALDNKIEAEKYLNNLQEHLVEIDLSSNEQRELSGLEKSVYKTN